MLFYNIMEKNVPCREDPIAIRSTNKSPQKGNILLHTAYELQDFQEYMRET